MSGSFEINSKVQQPLEIQAVAFDLDGTLLPTEVLEKQILVEIFHDLTGEELKPSDLDFLTGFSREDWDRKVEDRFLTSYRRKLEADACEEASLKLTELSTETTAAIDQLVTSFVKNVRARFHPSEFRAMDSGGLQAYEGVSQMLSDVSTHYHAVLATSSGQSKVQRIVQNNIIAMAAFCCVVTADCVSNRKPHPEPYLAAHRRLQEAVQTSINIGNIIAVEDSDNGLESAIVAGMPTILIDQDEGTEIKPELKDQVIAVVFGITGLHAALKHYMPKLVGPK